MPTALDPPLRRELSGALGGRLRDWPARHDPGHGVLRRAARVTVAGCVGFYVCRYLLEAPTLALYAVFGTIAFGVLSTVPGTPSQRTRTYLGALVVGLGLVTLGTLLAVSTWAAVAGMLAVGFAVAYAGIGGPRYAGVANGLQLFYILPCFPPYAPDELPARLAGVAVGVGLLTVADRLLWPAPAPPDFARRVGRAAAAAADYAFALRDVLRDGARPAALADPTLLARRTAAIDTSAALRLGALPVAERPTGPSARDRGLVHAAAGVRVVCDRLGALGDLLAGRVVTPTTPLASELVDAVAATVRGVAVALRDGGPAPSTEQLECALEEYRARRAERIAHPADGPPSALRAGVTASAIAEAARIAVLATRGALGCPPPPSDDLPAALWFLRSSRAQLWRQRLRSHLTPRSVYLQNAVRLAVGLAVARAVAGVFDLSHGFWVLLATLSLMRTSVAASRATLLPAFLGTVAGALVGGVLLMLLGADTTAYAWALPPVMLLVFTAGPLFGVAAGQAGFTVVVTLLFAQVAPSTYRLAETRLLDVVVGGLVGALIGAAVWPRGGSGELRRVAAAGLRAGADEVLATTRFLLGSGRGAEPVAEPVAEPPRLAQVAALFDHAYAQFRAEPTGGHVPPDWLVLVGVVHRLDSYARALRRRHPDPGPPPWPELSDRLLTEASNVADCYRAMAETVEHRANPPTISIADEHRRLIQDRPTGQFGDAPPAALRVFDLWGWLHDLTDDLGRIERALEPVPSPAASPAPAPGPGPGPAASPAPSTLPSARPSPSPSTPAAPSTGAAPPSGPRPPADAVRPVDRAALLGTALAAVVALTFGSDGDWDWLAAASGVALLAVLGAFFRLPPRGERGALAESAAMAAVAALAATLVVAAPLQVVLTEASADGQACRAAGAVAAEMLVGDDDHQRAATAASGRLALEGNPASPDTALTHAAEHERRRVLSTCLGEMTTRWLWLPAVTIGLLIFAAAAYRLHRRTP